MSNKEYFPRVESYLGKYARWKSRLAIIETELAKLKPSITPTYSDMPPTVTNKTSDTTGDMATRRMDLGAEYKCLSDKVKKIEIAIEALTDQQKELFELRYIRKVNVEDIKGGLEVGKSRYYQIRDSLVDTVHEIIQDAIY